MELCGTGLAKIIMVLAYRLRGALAQERAEAREVRAHQQWDWAAEAERALKREQEQRRRRKKGF